MADPQIAESPDAYSTVYNVNVSGEANEALLNDAITRVAATRINTTTRDSCWTSQRRLDRAIALVPCAFSLLLGISSSRVRGVRL